MGLETGRAHFEGAYGDDGLYRCVFSAAVTPEASSNSRKRHLHRKHERAAWDNLLYHISYGKRPKQPLKRFTVRCERHSEAKMDFDNLVISFKDVIDAFRAAMIIENDGEDNVGGPGAQWSVARVPCKRIDRKIVVTITEMQ